MNDLSQAARELWSRKCEGCGVRSPEDRADFRDCYGILLRLRLYVPEYGAPQILCPHCRECEEKYRSGVGLDEAPP